ncbi:disease resistance protein RGA5-like [Oryza glaberrima]|uniref:disease resistance protein RGA5-like n=1 Tax=Oryza glaberrima TaxID=4538 RepID=UPI00224C3AE0|nr:disease resistance protein RGA5-like [Oryza glaberrima]
MEGIMVSAATGVMNSVLAKLTTLLGEEYKLQKRVKPGIKYLKDELSSMNALLEKLANMDNLDQQAKDWRNQVREMAYDIEDCIDQYILQLQDEPNKPAGFKGFFRKMVVKVKKLGACRDIYQQIQELKTRIDEVSQRRYRYKLDAVVDAISSTSRVETIDPRLPARYAEPSSLVGIDGPTEELIKLLDDGKQSMKVVSIVGLGGLGKTTLANRVYERLGQQFDCKAFVSVSQKPDAKKIFQSLLSQIKGPVDETREMDWLIHELRDFLKDKRYAICFNCIPKGILMLLFKNTCSRILLTTRKVDVAKRCCHPDRDTVCEIRPLNEPDSEDLFFRRIFGSKDQCPIHLKDVSVEIIKKCGGLPLALITISSLLAVKQKNKDEWLNIRNSIGMGLDKKCDIDKMKRILSLSYSDLPNHLKTCLLYLSMYPEDYEINVQQLVRRWRAEGFIKVNCGRNLMDEGESYLYELINRSLIQPVVIGIDGRAMTCRVHDIVLDLIVSKAVEDNFITVVDSNVSESQENVRRFLLDVRDKENVMSMFSLLTPNVRSLGIFGYPTGMPPIPDFHALRVLNIEGGNKKLITSCNIGKVPQLRYLRIAVPAHLPEQIEELKFLETLDLCDIFNHLGLMNLPASIVKLHQLKCLSANCERLPDGIGNMKALEELSGILVDEESSVNSLHELGRLTKLRRLCLIWSIPDKHDHESMYVDALALSLRKLSSSNLMDLRIGVKPHITGRISLDSQQNLYLRITDTKTRSWKQCNLAHISLDFLSSPSHILQQLHIAPCCLHGIPERMASLASLTNLSILVHQVTQETLQILGDLPALLALELQSDEADDTTERLSIYSNKFGCLKILDLKNLAIGVMFHEGAMPKLETIFLRIKAHSAQSACGYQDLTIRNLSALKYLNFTIDCRGATDEEVEVLQAAIKDETTLLPNWYALRFSRLQEEEDMVSEGSEEGHAMEQEEDIPNSNNEH